MKATIRDVARVAGVSIGTVSRVLNGHVAVSDESRDRVNTVVRTLDYYPLRKRRSSNSGGRLQGKRIAIVLLGMDRSLIASPIVGEVVHEVEAALAEGGGQVQLVDIPRLDQVPVVMKQDDIDGLILFGALQGNLVEAAKPALIKRLSALPSVWFIRRPDGCWGDSVGPNDWLVGKLVANHLIDKGHHRLAFLNPRGTQSTWRLRGLSFGWHAEAAGAEVKTHLGDDEFGVPFPLRSTHNGATIDNLVDALLAESPRPTALFIPADSMAPFVYRALATRGVEVGKDISLISCNYEQSFTEALQPTLTTFDIQADLIARLAVRQLAVRLRQGNTATTPVEIAIEPSFVQGGSVAELRR